MRVPSPIHGVAMVVLVGALACARNPEADEAGTARVDTTTAADTVQNPPGYRGMEQDTTMVPPEQQQPQEQPVDTFLQQQGTDPQADTAGYGGLERPDTAGMQRDSAGMQRDTTAGETTEYQPQQQTDTTGGQPEYQQPPQQQQQTDTAGYQPQQQQMDTTGYQQQTDTAGYQQQGQTGQTDSVRLPHDSTRLHRDSAGVTEPDTGASGGQAGQTGDTGNY
jgi:hypothetical protein